MKNYLTAVAILLFCQSGFGQLDSVAQSRVSDTIPVAVKVKNRVARVDSLTTHFKNGHGGIILNDTIASINRRLDSVQLSLNTRIDSLTRSYSEAANSLQFSIKRYQLKLDSLQQIGLPAVKYKSKVDSLNRKISDAQQETIEKLEGMKRKAMENLKSIEYPPELEEKAAGITDRIGALNINSFKAGVTGHPALDGLENFKTSLSITEGTEFPPLPSADLLKNDITNNGLSIPETGRELNIDAFKDASKVGEQVAPIQEIAKSTADITPNAVEKLAEAKALELEEVKALQETSSNLPIGQSMNEKEMKAKLTQEAAKAAVDHFAGKQEELKAAMTKISKYKEKYSSVKSVADVVRKPVNEMKGKPLIERLVPGVGIQFQKKGNDLLFDFNPYIGYRLTRRITGGIGWNERVPYNLDLNCYNPDARIFGPRLFGEFKFNKGFSPRLELEIMNTTIPPSTILTNTDPKNREWIYGVFIGMKKDYKLFGRVRGTAFIMTRVMNPGHKSPYGELINLRFGFELSLKKRR